MKKHYEKQRLLEEEKPSQTIYEQSKAQQLQRQQQQQSKQQQSSSSSSSSPDKVSEQSPDRNNAAVTREEIIQLQERLHQVRSKIALRIKMTPDQVLSNLELSILIQSRPINTSTFSKYIQWPVWKHRYIKDILACFQTTDQSSTIPSNPSTDTTSSSSSSSSLIKTTSTSSLYTPKYTSTISPASVTNTQEVNKTQVLFHATMMMDISMIEAKEAEEEEEELDHHLEVEDDDEEEFEKEIALTGDDEEHDQGLNVSVTWDKSFSTTSDTSYSTTDSSKRAKLFSTTINECENKKEDYEPNQLISIVPQKIDENQKLSLISSIIATTTSIRKPIDDDLQDHINDSMDIAFERTQSISVTAANKAMKRKSSLVGFLGKRKTF
jgi:hypothetical protein